MPIRELIYELHLPAAIPLNNAIKSMDFHAHRKLCNGWHASVLAAIWGKVPATATTKSALKTERYSAGSLDWDSAYGGLKPLLDCLVVPSSRNPEGLGLIEDDSPKFMPKAPQVFQLPAKRGQVLRWCEFTPWTNCQLKLTPGADDKESPQQIFVLRIS